jgi:hypothetical protein
VVIFPPWLLYSQYPLDRRLPKLMIVGEKKVVAVEF